MDEPTLEEDTQSLVPVLTTLLAAAAAYAAAGRVRGASETAVDTALDVSARLARILANIALRILTFRIGKLRNKTGAAAMTLAVDKAVEAAVRDASKVAVRSLAAVVDNYPDPGNVNAIARRVAQAARNSAVFNAAEMVEKAAEMGEPTAGSIRFRKTWHSMNDLRVRSTHAFLGSPTYEFHVVDLAEPFITIAGNKLRFPGDPTAPISETANCRCWITVHVQPTWRQPR